MPNLDVTIAKHDLAKLLEQNEEQAKHVTALQADLTRVQEAQLSRRVRAFHIKFGHPVRTTPAVPADEEVRFRLKLIAEEFVELLDACLVTDEALGDFMPKNWKRMQEEIQHVLDNATINVNLPECVDALVDLSYVIEGAHAVIGTHAEPFLADVQRANMAKDAVYVQSKDGFHKGTTVKPTKPAGWTPPDPRAELLRQGWKP